MLVAALVAAAGCSSVLEQAPVDDLRPNTPARPEVKASTGVAAPVAPAVPAGQYTIRRGDTLYSIALEHGADYRDVAQWNKLDDPTKISVGQVIRVAPPEGQPEVQVGAARSSVPLESRPLDGAAAEQQARGDGGAKTAPKALRLPYSVDNLALLSKADPSAAAAANTPAVASAVQNPVAMVPAPSAKPELAKPAAPDRDPEAIDFIWPARGSLLAGYSDPGSKGVDIGGKSGDPVLASAAGQVLYTGTGIRGFGKLIVIRHENGFSSVYAHNREILVKEGQTVSRGQRIAELGDSDADRPKLHFEIRKSGKPVDPLKYLPGDRPS